MQPREQNLLRWLEENLKERNIQSENVENTIEMIEAQIVDYDQNHGLNSGRTPQPSSVGSWPPVVMDVRPSFFGSPPPMANNYPPEVVMQTGMPVGPGGVVPNPVEVGMPVTPDDGSGSLYNLLNGYPMPSPPLPQYYEGYGAFPPTTQPAAANMVPRNWFRPIPQPENIVPDQNGVRQRPQGRGPVNVVGASVDAAASRTPLWRRAPQGAGASSSFVGENSSLAEGGCIPGQNNNPTRSIVFALPALAPGTAVRPRAPKSRRLR